jgi:ATP-binding cassette, subfamily B, bacterial
MAGMLSLILASTGLTLLNPLIMRDLIDRTLPSRNLPRLAWLSAALLRVPLAMSGQDAHLPHPPPVRAH